MGIVSFFKSLINQEAAGDQVIATIEKMYQMMVKAQPNVNPHVHLMRVYQIRSSGFGKLKNDAANVMEASMTAKLHACVPPPNNIRALALFLLFKERIDIIQACPRFMGEYDMYMRPVEDAKSKGKLDELFNKYNPYPE